MSKSSLLSVIIFLISCNTKLAEDRPRLNEIRVIGSHNSYKKAIEPGLYQILISQYSAQISSLQYEHIPISDQLDLGLRNLEVDIYQDPYGGKFSDPSGLSMMKEQGVEPLPFDTLHKMDEPGFKVLHVQDIDFRSQQLLFRDFLTELKTWSEQNPDHLPVFVTLEIKDSNIERLTAPYPTTDDTMDSVDQSLRTYLGQENLITPDWVRGDAKDLNEVVTQNSWPLLEDCRGKYAFILDGKGPKRDLYMKDHPALRGRAMFINADPDTPESAFMVINNPVSSMEEIKEMVKKGYIIRTRADAGTEEARNNDYSRFEAAKASGAQIITTDYYLPSGLFESTYRVSFPDEKYAVLPR